MSLPHSVAEIIQKHVTLEVECIDRMYLNVYVPALQHEGGVAAFFRFHRGEIFASSALMEPISFEKKQRKDDVAAEYLAASSQEEGVLFVGKAQEKTPVFRTEKRRNPQTGQTYPWIVRSTAMVNHYYFYCVDKDFGPFFLKFCSYFPYTAKLCLNGHEYLKRQLGQAEFSLTQVLDRPVSGRIFFEEVILENLSALRTVGFQANRRLLDVQQVRHDCMLDEDAFREVTQPIHVDGQRASALRFADPCVLALLSALLVFRLLPQGFSNRQFREHRAPLLGERPSEITPGRMTYQLRRLRLHALIVRQPGTHRYRVTDFGLRTALFFTRSYARLLRPDFAQVTTSMLPDDLPLRKAFDDLEAAMNRWAAKERLVA